MSDVSPPRRLGFLNFPAARIAIEPAPRIEIHRGQNLFAAPGAGEVYRLGTSTAFGHHLSLHSSYCFNEKRGGVQRRRLVQRVRRKALVSRAASTHVFSSDVPAGVDIVYIATSIC